MLHRPAAQVGNDATWAAHIAKCSHAWRADVPVRRFVVKRECSRCNVTEFRYDLSADAPGNKLSVRNP